MTGNKIVVLAVAVALAIGGALLVHPEAAPGQVDVTLSDHTWNNTISAPSFRLVAG